MLNNEKSLKEGRAADRLLAEYEAIMVDIKKARSEYVEIKQPGQCSASRTLGASGTGMTPLFNSVTDWRQLCECKRSATASKSLARQSWRCREYTGGGRVIII